MSERGKGFDYRNTFVLPKDHRPGGPFSPRHSDIPVDPSRYKELSQRTHDLRQGNDFGIGCYARQPIEVDGHEIIFAAFGPKAYLLEPGQAPTPQATHKQVRQRMTDSLKEYWDRVLLPSLEARISENKSKSRFLRDLESHPDQGFRLEVNHNALNGLDGATRLGIMPKGDIDSMRAKFNNDLRVLSDANRRLLKQWMTTFLEKENLLKGKEIEAWSTTIRGGALSVVRMTMSVPE